METPRDDQLIADLRALRPAPRPEFAAELDQRAATGFPRRTHWRWTPFERLRSMQPRKLLIPAGGIAIVAIAVTTALVAMQGTQTATNLSIDRGSGQSSKSQPSHPSYEYEGATSAPEAAGSEEAGDAITRSSEAPTAGAANGAKALSFDGSGAYSATKEKLQPFSNDVPTRTHNRAVERSAELVL